MNKIIIPAAMLAVGVALVGSISSTLAWYQYSTKAQAAFIGTSIGQSENLEIKTGSGENIRWKSNLTTTDVNALAGLNVTHPNLLPVTPGITVAKDGAIPAKTAFKAGIETGVAGYGDQRGDITTNVVQFTLNIHYKKTDSQVSYEAKKLKLVDLTIGDSTANSQVNQGDLYKAIRVHFSAGESNRLYANNGVAADETITTATSGRLDTDNSGAFDKALGYEWETQNQQDIVYGVADSQQVAYNTSYADNLNWEIGTLPADDVNGLAVTVTIWLEGWQKLTGLPSGNADDAGEQPKSAMWDPLKYVNKKFNVGMRFQAVDAD